MPFHIFKISDDYFINRPGCYGAFGWHITETFANFYILDIRLNSFPETGFFAFLEFVSTEILNDQRYSIRREKGNYRNKISDEVAIISCFKKNRMIFI